MFGMTDIKYLTGEYPFNIAHFSRVRKGSPKPLDALFDGRRERARREREKVDARLEAHFSSYPKGRVFSANRLNETKSGGIGCSRPLALEFIDKLLAERRIETVDIGQHGSYFRKVK